MKIINSFLTILFFTNILFAGPFLQGNEIDTPHAYILPHTFIQISGAATLYDKDFAISNMFQSLPQYTFGVDLKIGLFEWVELGGAYLGTDVWSGFAKLRLLRESSSLPAVSIGIQNMSTHKKMSQYGSNSLWYYDYAQNFSFFGVITKDISYIFKNIPVIVNFGIGSGRYQGERPRSQSFKGIFGGIEVTPIRNIKIIADLDGKDLNLGSIYRLNDNIELLFAWTEIEQTFGVNYSHRSYSTEQQKFQLGVRLTYGPFFGQAETLRRQRELEVMSNYEEELEELKARREEAERELERLRNILESSQ